MAVTSRYRPPPGPGVPDTLADVLKNLFDTTKAVMQRNGLTAALAREGIEVALSKSPEDCAAFLTEDSGVWANLVKDACSKRE